VFTLLFLNDGEVEIPKITRTRVQPLKLDR